MGNIQSTAASAAFVNNKKKVWPADSSGWDWDFRVQNWRDEAAGTFCLSLVSVQDTSLAFCCVEWLSGTTGASLPACQLSEQRRWTDNSSRADWTHRASQHELQNHTLSQTVWLSVLLSRYQLHFCGPSCTRVKYSQKVPPPPHSRCIICLFSCGDGLSKGGQRPFQLRSIVIETLKATGHLLCLLYYKQPLGQSRSV